MCFAGIRTVWWSSSLITISSSICPRTHRLSPAKDNLVVSMLNTFKSSRPFKLFAVIAG